MKKKKVVILGAGVAGISCAYHIDKNLYNVEIYDKNNYIGGLASSFKINDFIFDRFIHLSFSENEDFKNEILNNKEFYYEHKPECLNYDNSIWIKHPAQNNLLPLPLVEKIKIIISFLFRNKKKINQINNYEEWLITQMGEYFMHKYPEKYTKKYWGVEPKELETTWIGNRIYSPSLIEIVRGAFLKNKKSFYYGKNMRYPKKGAFWSFFESFAEKLDIKLNKEIVNIDYENKKISVSDGSYISYDILISSIPLTEYPKLIKTLNQDVKNCCMDLKYTSGYIVSIGIEGDINLKDCLWFYIYDENIPFARVYISSKKSPQNSPAGKSSMQAEIYFINSSKIPDKEFIKEKTITSLVNMGLFTRKQIIFVDIRYEKYANIIFDKNIYKNREKILQYLEKIDVKTIGRFGKWEYFWSDQAWLDAMEVAKNVNQ